jgi:hypothetical protein
MRLAAEKFFFWLFLASNDRSCRETYKSKILLFSNASMKDAEFYNFRVFRNRLKNEFFSILTLFWDYFYLCSLFKVRESLRRYRKEFSIKLPISVVTNTTFSKRLPVYKGWGVYSLIPFFSRYFGYDSIESWCPKKMNADSESRWNSASFDILLKKEKDVHDSLIMITKCKKSWKIMHNFQNFIFSFEFSA